MTEDSLVDGNYLVRVCAQVMTRDDSSGGWVPLGGGGLSKVSVRKRPVDAEEDTKYEYFIYGKRISDKAVILSYTINKDFQYNKVMPTFFHWICGDKKYGLTFQAAADARAFDKGVRQAMEDLCDGFSESSCTRETDVGEDDVFMTLELPMERGDSRSSSGSSTNGGSLAVVCPTSAIASISTEGVPSSPYMHPHSNDHHLHRMHYMSRPQRTSPVSPNSNGTSSSGQNGSSVVSVEQYPKEPEEIWVKNEERPQSKEKKESMSRDNDKIEIMPGDAYSYVQFSRDRPSAHEYSYPLIDALKADKRDSVSSTKKTNFEMKPPLLPTKTKKKKMRKKDKHKHLLMERTKCRYCHEMFSEEDNDKGNCEYAPDRVRSCINYITCISCAQCMLYHCMSDEEGDFTHHPCSCDASDDHCSKRWIGLTILSFLVPCLCCYPPLRACHKCGISCGICGGRHEAAS